MSFDSYNDLIIEIESLVIRISDMERERDFLRKSMYANAPKFKGVVDYSQEHVSGGPMPLPLDKIIERLNKIDDSLYVLNQLLYEKRASKQRLEQVLGGFEGLDYKVSYMRDIKGMRLQEIADELGYSHEHIRRISSRIKKRKHAT